MLTGGLWHCSGRRFADRFKVGAVVSPTALILWESPNGLGPPTGVKRSAAVVGYPSRWRYPLVALPFIGPSSSPPPIS
jgi:hypothetical protein